MVCSTEIDSFPFHALRFRSCLLSFILRRFKFSRSQLLVLKSNSSCFSPNSASNSIRPGFGTKCVDCQLVTCNAMPKWKAKYFFFIKHCWKSVYFQTFLFFIYVYFSVFFFCGFLWSPSAHIGRPRRSDWLLKFIVCKLKFLSTRTSKSIGNAQHSAEFQHLSSAQLVSVIVIVRISDWGGRMVGAWHWYGIWWLLCARAAAHHGSLVFIKTAMCHETYFDKTNKNFRAPLANGEWVLVAE